MNHRKPVDTIPAPFLLQFSKTFNDPDENFFKLNQIFKEFGQKMLETTLQVFIDAGVADNVTTRLIEDEDPAEYAKRVVDEEGFDLVALGAKGQHSKLREVFLGSVCEKIMNQATVDVLIVK